MLRHWDRSFQPVVLTCYGQILQLFMSVMLLSPFSFGHFCLSALAINKAFQTNCNFEEIMDIAFSHFTLLASTVLPCMLPLSLLCTVQGKGEFSQFSVKKGGCSGLGRGHGTLARHELAGTLCP